MGGRYVSKFTAEQQSVIYDEYLAGMTRDGLKDKYNVCVATIDRIILRQGAVRRELANKQARAAHEAQLMPPCEPYRKPQPAPLRDTHRALTARAHVEATRAYPPRMEEISKTL